MIGSAFSIEVDEQDSAVTLRVKAAIIEIPNLTKVNLRYYQNHQNESFSVIA